MNFIMFREKESKGGKVGVGCSEYDFTFKSTLSFKTREQFAMSIYDMLDSDLPVITRVGL